VKLAAQPGPFAETRHNPTARSGRFESRQPIAAHVAQESSRQDHTAAPLPDDREPQVCAGTRLAIKRVQNSSAARVSGQTLRSATPVCVVR